MRGSFHPSGTGAAAPTPACPAANRNKPTKPKENKLQNHQKYPNPYINPLELSLFNRWSAMFGPFLRPPSPAVEIAPHHFQRSGCGGVSSRSRSNKLRVFCTSSFWEIPPMLVSQLSVYMFPSNFFCSSAHGSPRSPPFAGGPLLKDL